MIHFIPYRGGGGGGGGDRKGEMKVKVTEEKTKMTGHGVEEAGGREKIIARRRVVEGEGGKDGSGGGNGKTVVVGVKMDPQSRELLTWALVKVSQPGDRVIAIHVLPNPSSSSSGKSPESVLAVIKSFDSVLAVYEGFCNLKQIDLKLKICRGSSARKVLVREANNFAATKLIVGINKNNRRFGSSSFATAKYSAKLLPCDCSVLAVNNGKIVFQKEAGEGTENCKANNSNCHANLVCKIDQSSSKNSKLANRCNSKLDCSLPTKGQVGKKANASQRPSSTCLDGGSDERLNSSNNPSLSDSSPKQYCSICAPFPETCQAGSRPSCTESEAEESVALVPAQTIENSPTSITILIRELPEFRPGWPLLRRDVLSDKKKATEKPKITIVSPVVHRDLMPMKSDKSAIPNLQSDNGATSHPSDVINEIKPVGLPKELEFLHEKYASICRLFDYQELVLATSNFSDEMLIGRGGSSRVYKGCLPDGKELAVKNLKPSEDALKEFVLEIEIITNLHHKNIISLYGFCFENNNLLLVYNCLSRGNLEENLHGVNANRNVLGWNERYKVAVGVAEALDYLHSGGSAQPVIHRDVKSSNILLSDDFEPQLCDFGLAKWASSASSHITCSDVAGTFGYLAPEYFMFGKVNEKIDVYAFGVVLLELISGRKPINAEFPKGQESLVIWAKPILQSGKVKQLMDPGLGNNYDDDQIERLILAASLCIRRAPQSRPRISQILKLLRGDDDVIKWAKLQISASEELDVMDDAAAFPSANIQSHLNLALLDVDVEYDSFSISSTEQSVDLSMAHGSLEDYLRRRPSRSSSFD